MSLTAITNLAKRMLNKSSSQSVDTNSALRPIQELLIKFPGIQKPFTQADFGAQGGSSNDHHSAFNLQVEEVDLTLANQAGQSLQVTAPPAAATAPTVARAKSTAA
jgi:hypothetical protein